MCDSGTVKLRGSLTAALAALSLAACSGSGAGGSAQTVGETSAPSTSSVPATVPDPAAATSEGSAATGEPGDGSVATGATDGSAATGDPGDTAATTAEEGTELPRGGTEIFPRHRLVGYVGYPGSHGMGRLGIGDLDERMAEIETQLGDFAGDREILPVAELIVSIVHPVPGADGTYRTHTTDEIIQTHLDAARRHDAILLLNIQAGNVDFLDEVKDFEQWLVEPDVGVALDPEWAVEPGQVPGEVYGRTTGSELDEVAAYLSDLVEEHDLPEKVMVFHQLHKVVVQEEQDLQDHEGVVIIKSVDGIGHPVDKVLTYDLVNEDTPDVVHGGFKIFLEEDSEFGPLMTPEEVLDLDPEVEYLMVE